MKVSVLVNNFNYANFLGDAVNSCLKENVELIVYDDGSTDESMEVLKRYNSHINIISNPNYNHTSNENQANAIYQAFLQSSGDIICLLDSDDKFSEDKISKILKVFKDDTSITTVQNLMLEMDSDGNLKNQIRPIIKDVKDIKSYIFSDNNFFHLFVPTSGLSFRRSFLEKVLPLEEDGLNFVWPDARLSLLSVFYGKIHTIMEPLTYYRIHGTNDSNARSTTEGHETYLKQIYLYFNKLAALNNLPKIEFSREIYLENTYFSLKLNRKVLKEFTVNDSPMYIWGGAGEAGQSIYHFLKKNKIKVDGFFDANPKRIGEKNMGLVVTLPKFHKGIKYIISPIHAYHIIKEQLLARGFVEGVDFINPYKEYSNV